MPEIEIIEEKPITMLELKEHLEEIKKDLPELPFRANKAVEYLQQFANEKKKDAEALHDALKGLNVLGLKEKHIVKLIDLQPADMDGLKTILAGETVATRQEDMQKILGIITSTG